MHEARVLSPESIPASGPRPGNRQPALTGELLARAIELASPPKKGDYTRQLSDGLLDLSEPTWDSPRAAASKPVEEKAGRPSPRFVDDAQAAGLRFTFDNGQTSRHLLPETMSGGVALLDFDGDGWLDVYCVQGGDLFAGTASEATANHAPGDRLFRNRGDGTFEDVTESSRIAAFAWGRGYGHGRRGRRLRQRRPTRPVRDPARDLCVVPQPRRRDVRGCDRSVGLAGRPRQPDLGGVRRPRQRWRPRPVRLPLHALGHQESGDLPERPRRVFLLRPEQGRAGSRPRLPQRRRPVRRRHRGLGDGRDGRARAGRRRRRPRRRRADRPLRRQRRHGQLPLPQPGRVPVRGRRARGGRRGQCLRAATRPGWASRAATSTATAGPTCW